MSYRTKSTDSFRTRKQFFVFDCVINGKKSFSDADFIQFIITERLDKLFTSEYFQIERKGYLKNFKCSLNIDQIYQAMQAFEKDNAIQFKHLEERYFIEIFKKSLPEEKFNSLLKEQHCHYCGITMKDIEILGEKGLLYKKNERGWTFEIDRKKPNLEYCSENCVAACYWCNNAKTDEFDDVEFMPIGQKIGEALKARLAK